MSLVNDVHSQLNATRVTCVHAPRTVVELQDVVRRAARTGRTLTASGGRHAMGGQQFATDGDLLDLRGLDRVVSTDAERGLLRVEAGAMWPEIVTAARAMRAPDGTPWAIRQKQTGVDAVTLGGSISANAHGRGLSMQPIGDDVEDLDLVLPDGEIVRCSRSERPELFSLVVGGYGLFGVIAAATLRLRPLQRVRRRVDVLDLEDALAAILRRIDEGCVYGDFQFVIDADDPRFLTHGVLACYDPVAADANVESAMTTEAAPAPAELSRDDWLALLGLAHVDKAEAFRRYAQHYLGTHGRVYDADTMQLATYVADYAELLQQAMPASGTRETLVIGEHYVPYARIGDFMRAAQRVLRERGTEVIYGTVRAIRRDTTSALPWATEDSACVIFNLRTPHTPEGERRTADTFRGLIDAATALGGSYFLTYHRHATTEQLLRAHPGLPAFAARKDEHDPAGRFTSDWWRQIRAQVADGTVEETA